MTDLYIGVQKLVERRSADGSRSEEWDPVLIPMVRAPDVKHVTQYLREVIPEIYIMYLKAPEPIRVDKKDPMATNLFVLEPYTNRIIPIHPDMKDVALWVRDTLPQLLSDAERTKPFRIASAAKMHALIAGAEVDRKIAASVEKMKNRFADQRPGGADTVAGGSAAGVPTISSPSKSALAASTAGCDKSNAATAAP